MVGEGCPGLEELQQFLPNVEAVRHLLSHYNTKGDRQGLVRKEDLFVIFISSFSSLSTCRFR